MVPNGDACVPDPPRPDFTNHSVGPSRRACGAAHPADTMRPPTIALCTPRSHISYVGPVHPLPLPLGLLGGEVDDSKERGARASVSVVVGASRDGHVGISSQLHISPFGAAVVVAVVRLNRRE